MDKSFDSKKYINHLADELIRNFAYASSATTPVLVGTAKEKEVIRKLELLLPKTIGVGSGCIIDSYGATSKQMDIVLYEKDLCPVFSINESSESTYYPCEGVVAVGEVKSRLNTKELDDIFEKASSVKSLKRYSIPKKSSILNVLGYRFRKYGHATSFEGAPIESFDQKNKSSDQIYCFALCGDLDVSIETLANNTKRLLEGGNYENEVNLITILNHGLFVYYDERKNAIKNNLKEAGSILITGKRENNFEYLLSTLLRIINLNRTVEIDAYRRYISISDTISLDGCFIEKIDKKK